MNAGVAAGILLVGVVASVLVDPGAAFGHSNYVTGVATCSTVSANVDITWTVSNDYNLSETASVVSATGGVGTVSGSPAFIPASPGQPYKFATMTQVLPASTTGSATLVVKGVWSDNYSTTDSGTVTLPTGCPATVTTAPGNSSIVLGASDADTATVTGVGGVTPTGGVTFYVCGPFTTATACTTSGTKLGTVTLAGSAGTATATGPSFTPTATGTYCFLGVYSGDDNYAGGSDGSTTRECFTVTKATPSFITTPANPSGIVLGSSSSDSATVTGVAGTAPTGTVTFSVCQESTVGTPCSGGSTVGSLTSPTSTSGAVATYTLAAGIYTPKATGTYCFNAGYGGDANYMGVALESDPAGECFAVTMATPGVKTSPTNASIVLGGSDTDTATVTGVLGVTPTGTVTFYVCGPFTTATACTTSGTKLGAGTLAGSGNTATTTSPSFTPTATGTYCFLGVYSGDGNYAGGSDGSTTRECFAVTPATPGVRSAPANTTILLGTSDSDTATVTGVLGVTPTGTVTFYVCGPFTSDTACTTSGTKVGTVALAGSGGTATATSPSYTPLASGTYCFLGVYSGDGNYFAGSDGSVGECFVVTGEPGFTTSPVDSSITLGGSNSDTATVTGVLGVTPTGSVTFYVCGPFTTATACTTSGTNLGAVTLAGSGDTATATGPSFTPMATGTYCFLGVYSGDANYVGGSDGSTIRECFGVTPATPGVTTSPTNATVPLDGSNSDTVRVKGVLGITPTGSVTFYLCTGASPCTPTTVGAVDLGPVALTGSAGIATATSASSSPLLAGTYCFVGVYSGDGNYLGGSDGSTTRECFTVRQNTPGVITTPAQATIVWGGSDSDGATVTGIDGITPTGNVHFYVCQGAAPCTVMTTGAVDLGMVALSGSGGTATATSPSYMPPTTGSYCFLGVYSGDGNYTAGSDGSSDECFTVTPPKPGVKTSPSDLSIVLTGSDSDTATVTGVMGVTPTGTVTFYVCGPFTSDTACTTSGTNLGTVTLAGAAGTATATSPSYTPTATGTYCFLGVYSGDGNYLGGSDGSTTRECFTVTMEPAMVMTTPKAASITLGQTDSDTVTVTGNAAGGTPTGTVTFYVCGPTATPTPCTAMTTKVKKAVKLKKGAKAKDTATATSAAFTPTKVGTWCFAGYYSGNPAYVGGSDTSVGECFTVKPAVVPCSLVVTVSPNPLVETGASEVHAIVEVQACASLAGDAVSIISSQLEDSCSSLTFENLQGTGPLPNVGTDSIVAYLDDDGNLDVVVNGTNCAPGQSVVEADLDAAPYWTATTTLVTKPPVVTAPGVTGSPNPEVETGDSPTTGNSDVYAVFYVETDPTYAEQTVDIDSAQLFDRCGEGATWTSNLGTSTTASASATLDDDGNAVFVFMGASCAAGTSDVIADVMAGTDPTYSTSYTILPPTPNT